MREQEVERTAALTCGFTLPTLLAGVRSVLKVSQKLEYAMRAMIELAQREGDGLIPARQIAERQHIPVRFLEQQLGALSRAGIVESFRGAGGGCRLARPAERITMADVADAIEGQIYPMFCLEPSDHTCFQDSRCGLQGFWADVARAIDTVFRETTVADLAARHRGMAPGRVFVRPEELLSRRG
jgi:Rrf2 family protein